MSDRTTDHLPPLEGNPLLEAHARANARDRQALAATFGFAVPSEEALDAIARLAPRGVVEIGAGAGYWARLLYERGVDVMAYDLHPPPSSQSRWFADVTPWYCVNPGDETAVDRHPQRTLLIVWPTRDETWPATAVERFHAAGGRRLVYVGEGPGGRTGDDRFHALLGTLDRCWPCAYDITNAPCVCEVPRLWSQLAEIDIPQWEGMDDRLLCFERTSGVRAT